MSVELEVIRMSQKQQKSLQDEIVRKTGEIEVRNKVRGYIVSVRYIEQVL